MQLSHDMSVAANPQKSDTMVVVVGSDDNYAVGLAVTIHTALSNTPTECETRLVILDGGISASNRRRLERVVNKARPETELDWLSADSTQFDGLKTTKWGSTANYLRLLIPKIIGNSAPWVLYLDSDLMIRADLSQLWKERLRSSDEILFAVQDYHNLVMGAVFGVDTCAALGLDPDSLYFNSGVLLLNVSDWQESDVPGRAVTFVRRHKEVMKHSDQDALNAVLADKWNPLDPKWNVMIPSIRRFLEPVTPLFTNRRKQKQELLEKGAIYHFTGPRKPWIPGYWGPAGSEYRKELFASGWFSSARERRYWHSAYWILSPKGWLKEGLRRLRKRTALRYRSLRDRQRSSRIRISPES